MAEEYLFLCDECNIPLDKHVARKEVHSKMNYWHRTTAIVIIDRDRRVLCQQRSFEKDENPGKWSYTFGGHVTYGEEILASAVKELHEEVGIIVPQDRLEFSSISPNDQMKHFSYRYSLLYDEEFGIPHANDGEVIALEWVPIEQLYSEEFTNERFTSKLYKDRYDALVELCSRYL